MKMRNLLVFFLLLSLLFSACTDGNSAAAKPVTESESLSRFTDSGDLTFFDVLIAGIKRNPSWTGYAGYSNHRKDYIYLYSEGRNRRWEEIVLEFADSFVSPYGGHPYLSDREVQRRIIDENFNISMDAVNLFNEEKRKIFIERTNNVISDIYKMTDTEVIFSLVRTVHEIKESHTLVADIPILNSYPLTFRTMYNNGTMDIYCSYAQKEHSDLVGCRLISINGTGIAEVLERLSPYIHAAEKISAISQAVYNFLHNWEALQLIGVVSDSDTTIEFELEDLSGKLITAVVEKIDKASFTEFYNSDEKVSIYDKFGKPYYRSRSEMYWCDILDDNILYIRISTFREKFATFLIKIKERAEDIGEGSKIILDLRDNGGGHTHLNLFNCLRDIGAEKVFILTNEMSQSASLVAAQLLRRYYPNVVVVGSYGWHTNFLSNIEVVKIENIPTYGTFTYFIPHVASQTSATTDLFSRSTELFTPDVVMYYEFDDFIEGRDTLMEWVKNQ